VVEDVNDIWKDVSLLESYASPVIACSVRYVTGATSIVPALVRMQNVQSGSFQIRLQNPSGSSTGSRDVHCIVVEEGSWVMPGNRLIEAKTYSTTTTSSKGAWGGIAQQSYTASFTQPPVVLGQVMSFNDPGWSVFWCRGTSRTSPPSATVLYTGIHVGEDSDKTRSSETVGYIAIEGGHGMLGSIEYEAKLGADSVSGYDNNEVYTYNYDATFGAVPEVTIVTQAAMDGNDGSWAVTSETDTFSQSVSQLGVVVDEDQISNSERNHTPEQVAYIALSAAGSVQLADP